MHIVYSSTRHAFLADGHEIALQPSDRPTMHAFADGSVIELILGERIGYAYLSNSIITTRNLGAAQWRWEFGVAIVLSILFLVMLYGIPRSSRWLVLSLA